MKKSRLFGWVGGLLGGGSSKGSVDTGGVGGYDEDGSEVAMQKQKPNVVNTREVMDKYERSTDAPDLSCHSHPQSYHDVAEGSLSPSPRSRLLHSQGLDDVASHTSSRSQVQPSSSFSDNKHRAADSAHVPENSRKQVHTTGDLCKPNDASGGKHKKGGGDKDRQANAKRGTWRPGEKQREREKYSRETGRDRGRPLSQPAPQRQRRS